MKFKNICKGIIVSVIALVLIVAIIPSQAVAAELGDGWSFDSTTGKLTITSDAGLVNWKQYRSDGNQDLVTSVEMDSTVTNIGAYTFYGCINLLRVTIPSSVTNIDRHAFELCTSLERITFLGGTPPLFGDEIFIFDNAFTVIVPIGQIDAYKTAMNLWLPAGSTIEDRVKVTGVMLDKPELTFTSIGAEETLTPTLLPDDATNRNVSWFSSDPNVATVDANGKVKAIANGFALITVITADGNIGAMCSVLVQPITVQITAQPQGGESAIYGYTSSPTLSVTAAKTPSATGGSEISYQWYHNGTSITSGNSANYPVPTGLDAGTHNYYCAITCDGYTVNTQNAEFTVTKATPTIEILEADNSDKVFGDTVSFAASVSGVNSQQPTGTLTLKEGNTNIATASLSNGYGAMNWTNIPAGDHTITMEYTAASDGTGKNYTNAANSPITFTVAKANQSSFSINEVTGKKYAADEFALSTTGGSGTGAVTYSVPGDNVVLFIQPDFNYIATIMGAGTVTVTATKAADDNYNSVTATREITIAKGDAPTINFPTAEGITYGHKLSESLLKGGSFGYGTFTWTSGNTVPTVTNSGYQVTFTPNAETLQNYETITDTTANVGITVSKSTPAVTVNATVSGNAGSRKATLTVEVTGVGNGGTPSGTVRFVNSTSGSDVDIAGAIAVAITDGQGVFQWTGTADQIYKIKAVYSGDDNYNTATSGELEIDTRKQNQSALSIGDIGTKTYGDGGFALTTTGGSGTGAVTFTSSDLAIVSISGATATIQKAGTVTITAVKGEDSTYNEVTTSTSLTIGKKVLTIKADDKQNIIKGAAMPTFTYAVTGLVDNDTFTSPTISTTVVDTGTVGVYDITISGGIITNADNYTVTYTGGKLTIINDPASQGGSPTGGGSTPTTSTDTTQPATGTPVIKDSGNKSGWEAIQEQIKQTQESETVTVEMNGSLIVPGEVLDTIRGTDITLVFDMGDGITWSVNGQSITDNSLEDINFGVTLDTDAIPENLINETVQEQNYRSITLSHNGSFGFTPVLSIHMEKKNAGLFANLFYDNPSSKKLELQSMGKINDSGYVEFMFTHASDYVVTISTESALEKAMDQIAISAVKGKLYVGGTQNKSMTLKLELPELLKDLKKNGGSDFAISYESSNPKVATVTDTGKIIAKKAGKTTITTLVTVDGVQKSFTTEIQVSKAYIKLTKSKSSLKKGETFTFQVKGYGVNTEDIMFYTSKKSIIVINKTTGKAVAKSTGTDSVIAKAGNVEVKIKVNVR